MKVAAILTVGALMLTPGLAFAQSADGATNHGVRSEAARVPHGTAASAPRATNDPDHAIDAETRRIDRMMTICTGC